MPSNPSLPGMPRSTSQGAAPRACQCSRRRLAFLRIPNRISLTFCLSVEPLLVGRGADEAEDDDEGAAWAGSEWRWRKRGGTEGVSFFFRTDGLASSKRAASPSSNAEKRILLLVPLVTALPLLLQQLPPRAETNADCIAELS